MIEDEELVAKIQKSIQISKDYHVIIGELFSRYFIQDHSGEIKYVRASFEIEQFENQYTRIAKTLVYIKENMIQKYGYDSTIQFIDEYAEDVKLRYKNLLKDARDSHILRKDTSYRRCIGFLSDNHVYKKLSTQKIELEKNNAELIDENEVGLHFGYSREDDVFKLTYNKEHKHTIEPAIKFTKKFRKLYSPDTIQQILELHENQNGILNKKNYNDMKN